MNKKLLSILLSKFSFTLLNRTIQDIYWNAKFSIEDSIIRSIFSNEISEFYSKLESKDFETSESILNNIEAIVGNYNRVSNNLRVHFRFKKFLHESKNKK